MGPNAVSLSKSSATNESCHGSRLTANHPYMVYQKFSIFIL
jgi:hypothetical protein